MSALPLRHRLRDWLADQLQALVWILLALWAPPIVFTVMVDLKLAGSAGSGYLSLDDPGLLLSLVQLVVMTAALRSMRRQRRSRAWQLLCGSLGLWLAHAVWTVQGRVRLVGRSDLWSRETLITIAAFAVAAYVLFEVRERYTRSGGDSLDLSQDAAVTSHQSAVTAATAASGAADDRQRVL